MLYKTAVFALLAIFINQGEALKCYSCSSVSESKCSDPIDTSIGLTECTPTVFKDATNLLKGAAETVNNFLGKIGVDANVPVPDADATFACVKAVRQDGEKKVVIRSCSVPKNEKFDICSQMKAQGGLVTFCETCDTEGCNGASGLTSSTLLLALLITLVAYFSKQ